MNKILRQLDGVVMVINSTVRYSCMLPQYFIVSIFTAYSTRRLRLNHHVRSQTLETLSDPLLLNGLGFEYVRYGR
jgi:hypothetical protein